MNNNNRKPAWKQRDEKPQAQRETKLGPLEVEVWNNDVEQAYKIFKMRIAKDGILAELKKRRHALKRGDARRAKHREALKKLRKSRGKKARLRSNTKQD